MKYDAWNRMIEAKDGTTVVGVYEYDGLNRRVKRHVDSQAPDSPNGVDAYVHYFYNRAWQVFETRDTITESDQPENMQPKYQYVWARRYVDAPVLRDGNTDADGLCDDERIYLLGDANFNVTALIDTAGDAEERYMYAPYGKLTIYDGSWASTRSTSNYDNIVLYTGREFDAETGVYQYRNRYYIAEMGRFVSRDPIGYASGDYNVYRYAANSPLDSVDPSGKGLYSCCNPKARVLVRPPTMRSHIIRKCWCHCIWDVNLRELFTVDSLFANAYTRAWQMDVTGAVLAGHIPDSYLRNPSGPPPYGLKKVRTGPARALGHCIMSGWWARRTNCKCGQCTLDERERWQMYRGMQSWPQVWQATESHRHGRECAGCQTDSKTRGWSEKATIDPTNFKTDKEITKCCTDRLNAGRLPAWDAILVDDGEVPWPDELPDEGEFG